MLPAWLEVGGSAAGLAWSSPLPAPTHAPASLLLLISLVFSILVTSGTGSLWLALTSLQTFSKHEGSRSPVAGLRRAPVVTQHLLSEEVRVTVEKPCSFIVLTFI